MKKNTSGFIYFAWALKNVPDATEMPLQNVPSRAIEDHGIDTRLLLIIRPYQNTSRVQIGSSFFDIDFVLLLRFPMAFDLASPVWSINI